jgi:hypothetical protein
MRSGLNLTVQNDGLGVLLHVGYPLPCPAPLDLLAPLRGVVVILGQLGLSGHPSSPASSVLATSPLAPLHAQQSFEPLRVASLHTGLVSRSPWWS